MFLARTMEQEARKSFAFAQTKRDFLRKQNVSLTVQKTFVFSLLLGSKLCFRVALHVNEETLTRKCLRKQSFRSNVSLLAGVFYRSYDGGATFRYFSLLLYHSFLKAICAEFFLYFSIAAYSKLIRQGWKLTRKTDDSFSLEAHYLYSYGFK